jgi:hypothetical protein
VTCVLILGNTLRPLAHRHDSKKQPRRKLPNSETPTPVSAGHAPGGANIGLTRPYAGWFAPKSSLLLQTGCRSAARRPVILEPPAHVTHHWHLGEEVGIDKQKPEPTSTSRHSVSRSPDRRALCCACGYGGKMHHRLAVVLGRKPPSTFFPVLVSSWDVSSSGGCSRRILVKFSSGPFIYASFAG